MALIIVDIPGTEPQAAVSPWRERLKQVTYDASYPNPSGYAITPQEVGMTNIYGIEVVDSQVTAGGLVPTFVRTSNFAYTAYLFQTGAAVAGPLEQIANATNVSAVSVTVKVTGL